jgi:hypothetical protein
MESKFDSAVQSAGTRAFALPTSHLATRQEFVADFGCLEIDRAEWNDLILMR